MIWASVASTIALIFGAADVSCTEAGRDYRDGAVVLQVVRNRAGLSRKGWKRYDGSLHNALWSPGQHAHGCRWPLTLKHIELGARFVLNRLETPPWARRALYYCNTEKPGTCENRCAGGCERLGRIAHTYFGGGRR